MDISYLAENAGGSVGQIERLDARNLPPSAETPAELWWGDVTEQQEVVAPLLLAILHTISNKMRLRFLYHHVRSRQNLEHSIMLLALRPLSMLSQQV